MEPLPQWEEAPVLCDDGLWRGRYRTLTEVMRYDYDGNPYPTVDVDVEVFEAECPYRPSERIAVRETYVWWSNDHTDIVYSDDPEYATLGNDNVLLNKMRANPDTADVMECVGFWQKVPAEQMPDWAVRTHLLCESNEAREIDGQWCWVVQVKKE
jgi:hypothetical protein